MARLLPLLLLLAAAPGARGQERIPVVEAGREADIIALVAPHEDEKEVVAGWVLSAIGVRQDSIRYTVTNDAGASASLLLRHRSAGEEDAERSASFTLTRELPDTDAEGAESALGALAAAIMSNDDGTFWRAEAEPASSARERPAWHAAARESLLAWAQDGLLWSLLGLGLLLWLVARGLADTPRGVGWALLGTVALGLALRLAIPDATTMTAWGYARVVPLAKLIYEGPLLSALTRATGASVRLVDLIAWTNLTLAVLSPLALFAHARHLLRCPWKAVAAGALLAVLPMHIRFAQSDVYFIQSIACSSLSFALVYTASKDRSRWLASVALVALPVLAHATFLVRPLNVVFLPLFVWTALWLVGRETPLWRRLLVTGLLVAAAVLASLSFLRDYGSGVSGALLVEALHNSVETITSLRLNTLINPWMTPPLFLLLSVGGAVWLWRQSGGRRRAVFLVVWLLAFLVTHSIILPFEPTMQARYHLHLVVPFVLLAAPAAYALWNWRRWAAVLVLVYGLAAPLVHLDFETDTRFDQQREYEFLAALWDEIPQGCTVIEFDGSMTGAEMPRSARAAASVTDGVRGSRWDVVGVGESGAGGDLEQRFGRLGLASPEAESDGALMAAKARQQVRDLLRRPHDCVYLYEGLRCWSEKAHTQDIAPACAALRDELRLETVREESFAPRVYDTNFAHGYGPDPAKPLMDEVTLRLYKVDGLRR